MRNYYWYRKICGGIWYKYRIEVTESAYRCFWTQKEMPECFIWVKEFNMSKSKYKKYMDNEANR